MLPACARQQHRHQRAYVGGDRGYRFGHDSQGRIARWKRDREVNRHREGRTFQWSACDWSGKSHAGRALAGNENFREEEGIRHSGGRHSARARDLMHLMRRLHPRSPYEKLGGYVHLPRLIDKAKLSRKGLLDGYNYKTVGFDKHLLSFLKLDGDAFEEAVHRLENDDEILSWGEKNSLKNSTGDIEHWNQTMISRHPDTAAKKARFSHFLKQSGGAGRKDIRTYFNLIEFDEGRLR